MSDRDAYKAVQDTHDRVRASLRVPPARYVWASALEISLRAIVADRPEIHHDAHDVEEWEAACADAQRKADSRRIVEVNERDLRRERVGLVLCLLAFVVTIFVLTIPR